MSTTLTNINDTLVVSETVGALKNGLIPVNAFSLEVATQGRVQNDVLRVPVITDPSAQSKTPGTALTSDGAAASTSVTLSAFYEAKFQLNEAQVNPSRASQIFAALAAGAAYSISKQVLDAALALVTATNYSNTAADKVTVAAGDFGQGDLGELLTKAEVKRLGRVRSLILNASYAGALVGESNLGLILATMGDKALQTAALPPLMGFTTYMYGALPTNSENLGGFVCDKAAIAVGMAPPEQLASAGEGNLIASEIITDADSKVAALYKRWYDADAGTIYGSIAVLYGVAKVQNSIIRIVSA